jgi:hypothetical protein
VKVKVKDAPFARVSDEMTAGAPASETMVWGALSLFTHVTVEPAFTVRLEGSNAKFLIAMVFPPPEEAVAGAGGAGAGGAGAGPEEQPAVMQARITRAMQAIPGIRREYSGMIH